MAPPKDSKPESNSSPQGEDSADVLDQYLESCLEELTLHAPVNSPADLQNFLPPSVPLHNQPLLLIEMIKLDMAISAEGGSIRSIEAYIAELSPPLSLQSVSLDLVLEEHQLLRSIGSKPKLSTEERFPHLAILANLASQLGDSTQENEAVDKTKPPPEIPPGKSIDDFLIVRGLGSGAFARVYLARQKSMQRLVALKVSHGTGGESQTLAKLDHPNTVRVFDQRHVKAPPPAIYCTCSIFLVGHSPKWFN